MSDVTSEYNASIALHWTSPNFPKQEILTLTAEHGREIRRYNLTFPCFEKPNKQ